MKPTNFETRKDSSLTHQLIKIGRLINEMGIQGARRAFALEALTQTHLDLFPHIDFGGTSISELAKRKEVSKQAMSKLVNEMVDMQLLELKPDPDDARAKLVFFKTKGPFSIQNGFKVLESIDKTLKKSLGAKDYEKALFHVSQVLSVVDESAQNSQTDS